MSSGKILVAGCGYVGESLATLAAARGFEVAALTATETSAAALAGRRPFPVRSCDLGRWEDVESLARWWGGGGTVIQCAGSGGGGPDAYRRVYLAGARHLAAAFPRSRLIFTGSTSVYAQTDGSWVDESSPPAPSRETGRILLEAERVVLGVGGVVARLAGIYGPGRCAPLRKLLDGTAALEGDGTRFVNQIHREDAASSLLHLHEAAPGIFNVCDDRPMTQRALFEVLCARFDVPLPPLRAPDLARKRGWTHKRVSNKKLRATGWVPQFPDFPDGLAHGGISDGAGNSADISPPHR